MNIDIQKITEGEESIVIRYKDPNPAVERIIGILEGGEHIMISRRYAVDFRRLLKGGR